MKYLCLIHCDRRRLESLPEREISDLNARHLELNEELLHSGHFIEAEALHPPETGVKIRVHNGRPSIVDGPFAETKEMLAGFYFIEARDLNEAVQVAARFPGAVLGHVEVRPCRDLVVNGVAHKASSKSAKLAQG